MQVGGESSSEGLQSARKQAYPEAAVVLIYVVGFNSCNWSVVTKPRGRTRAGEVA